MGKLILFKSEKGWVCKFLCLFPKSLFVLIQLLVFCLARGLDAFFFGFTKFFTKQISRTIPVICYNHLIIFSVFILLDNTPTTSTSIYHSKEIINLSQFFFPFYIVFMFFGYPFINCIILLVHGPDQIFLPLQGRNSDMY